jgi:2,4-dienoyl-CoA reductase-like NADH-dependent reductase (Old Yellow Enzyme family)/thioredoxin reductase
MQLFRPIKVGDLALKNRIAMPAMATNFGNADGSVSERLIEYYRARAEGGVGLIIIEFTAVSFDGRFTQNQLRIDRDQFLEGQCRLVEHLHEAGAHVFLQLHHSGRRSPPNIIMTQPMAPSALAIFPGAVVPREMSLDDIYRVRDAFIQGAARAKKVGYDGVEIHATHGYLLAQFLSPLSNRRADAYGGNPENRTRLPIEILNGVKQINGSDFTATVKITGDEYTPGGIELDEALVHAREFEKNGTDALCVSGSAGSLMAISPNAPGTMSTSPPSYVTPACYAHLSAAVKAHVSVPVMAIGRIYDPQMAESLLRESKADMVAVGRGHIADPAFANKAGQKDLDNLCYCIGCLRGCIERSVHWSNTGITCAVNPMVGRESESTGLVASKPKRVMVIGGGPAGMNAAAIMAERGHHVNLYEKEHRLGGNVVTASVPPGKSEAFNLIRYLSGRLKRSGAKVHLNSTVDINLVKSENPDVVVICAGATPIKLKVPGIETARAVTAAEVLQDKVPIMETGTAVVVGGGLVGCETSLFLAKRGWKIIILEMLEEIGIDVGPIVRFYLRKELDRAGVKIQTRSCVTEFRKDQVVCGLPDGDESLQEIDLAVLAIGYESDRRLFNDIRSYVRETYVIGDGLEPRRILEAMRESFDIGQEI